MYHYGTKINLDPCGFPLSSICSGGNQEMQLVQQLYFLVG